jgi:hypothetical protein
MAQPGTVVYARHEHPVRHRGAMIRLTSLAFAVLFAAADAHAQGAQAPPAQPRAAPPQPAAAPPAGEGGKLA